MDTKGIIRLLLIEDNPGDIRLIEIMLTDESAFNIEVIPATTISKAIEILSKDTIDIILSDLNLPDSKGIETIDKIRKNAPDLPVVVITEIEDRAFGIKTIEKGAQDYLSKQHLDEYNLIRSIFYAIERKTQEELLIKQNDKLRQNELELLAKEEELRTQNEELMAQEEELRIQNEELLNKEKLLSIKNDELKKYRQKLETGIIKAEMNASEFTRFFDSLSSCVAVYEVKNNGETFIFKDLNKAAEQVEKIKKEDVIGKDVLDVFPGIKEFGLLTLFKNVYKTGEPEVQNISLYKDHRIEGWRINRVYKMSSGDIVAVYEDLTETKEMEKALKESELRFSTVFESSDLGITLISPNKNFITANPAIEKMLGYDREEFCKLNLKDILHESNFEKFICNLNNTIANKGDDSFIEYKLINKNGKFIWVLISLTLIQDETNVPLYVFTMIQDITERKIYEEKLKQTQFCVDHSSIPSFSINEDSTLLYVNKAACNHLGYTFDELITMNVIDFDVQMTPELWKQHWADIKEDKIVTIETKHKTKTGEIKDFLVTANYFEYEGKIFNFASGFDITIIKKLQQDLLNKNTELKAQEEQLIAQNEALISQQKQIIASKAMLQSVLDQAPTGVLVGMVPDMKLTVTNKAAAIITGLKSDKWPDIRLDNVDLHYENFYPDGTKYEDKDLPLPRALRDEETIQNEEILLKLSDGTEKWVLVNASPVYDSDNNLIAATAVFADITERKKLENELLEHKINLEKLVEQKTEDLQKSMLELTQILRQLRLSEETVKEQLEKLQHTNTELEHTKQLMEFDATRINKLLQLNDMTEATTKEIINFALETALNLTKSEIGYFGMVDGQNKVIYNISWSKNALNLYNIKDIDVTHSFDETGFWTEALKQKKVYINNNSSGMHLCKEHYNSLYVPAKRFFSVPIYESGNIVAIAGVINKEKDYDDSDIKHLTLLMQGVWRLLQRRSANKRLITQNEALQATLKQLEETESKYEKLVSKMEEVVVIIQPLYNSSGKIIDFEIVDYNNKCEEMFKLSQFGRRTIKFKEMFKTQEDHKYYYQMVKKVLKSNKSIIVEKQSVLIDKYFRMEFFAISDNIVCHIMNDLTEIKKVQDILAKKNEQLEDLIEELNFTQYCVDNAAGYTYFVDKDSNVKGVNKATSKMLGYSQEELSSMSVMDFDPNFNTKEKWYKLWHKFVTEKESTIETINISKNGLITPVELSVKYLQHKGKEYVFAYGINITEKIEAQKTIKNQIVELKAKEEELLAQNEELYAKEEELTEQNEELSVLKDRLQLEHNFSMSIIKGTINLIIGIKLDGTINYINPSVEILTGFTEEELIGHNLWKKLFTANEKPLIDEFIKRFKNSNIRAYELPITAKSGYRYIIAWTSINRYDIDGNLLEILFVGNNLTDLINARKEAEAASKAKSDFLAIMSHEIRTPLNGIVGLLDLLFYFNDPTPKQKEYLEMINTSAEGLLNIINDILDFSKIEAGKFILFESAFSLRNKIGILLKSLCSRAHSKGLELIYYIDPEVPDFLIGDYARLNQIIINFIGNAIKFTEKGDVSLYITIDSKDNDSCCLRFCVIDTGIGIPQDKKDHIFDSFAQVDATTTRKYGGTGLGLPICIKLVDMMGGNIYLETEINKGSKFSFTANFKLQKDESGKPIIFKHVKFENLNVLLLDKNKKSNEALCDFLSYCGINAICPDENCELADIFNKLRENDSVLDFIIVDSNILKDGCHYFIKEFSRIEGFETIPVIALTYSDETGAFDCCSNLNFVSLLTKPVMHSTLINEIKTKVLSEEPEQILQSQKQAYDIPKGLKILVVEDSNINQILVKHLLSQIDAIAIAVNNGFDAIEIFKKQPFDLILMDIQMPEINGFDTTRKLRMIEKGTGTHTPVIALTAYASEDDRNQCINAGMDHYISKPFNKLDLYESIEALIKQSKSFKKFNNKTVKQLEFKSNISKEDLLENMDNNEEILKEIVQVFLKESPEHMKKLEEAVLKADKDALKAQAHFLKGIIGIYNDKPSYEIIIKLENMAKAGDLTQAKELYQQFAEALELLQNSLNDIISEND